MYLLSFQNKAILDKQLFSCLSVFHILKLESKMYSVQGVLQYDVFPTSVPMLLYMFDCQHTFSDLRCSIPLYGHFQQTTN